MNPRLIYHESGHSIAFLALGVPLQEIRIDENSGFCQGAYDLDKRSMGKIYQAGYIAEEILTGSKIKISERTNVRAYGVKSDLTALIMIYGNTSTDEFIQDYAETRKTLLDNWCAVQAIARACEVHGSLTRTKILAALDKAGITNLPGIEKTRQELERLQAQDTEQAEQEAQIAEMLARKKFKKFCESENVIFSAIA